MNPIKISLFILLIWIISGITYAFNVSNDVFEGMMYTFYLSPLVGIISLIISLFFYKTWTKRNNVMVILYLIILIVWTGGVFSYILSL